MREASIVVLSSPSTADPIFQTELTKLFSFPAEFPVGFLDREVVDAGETALHVAKFIKFPELVTVGTEPLAGIIVPLVFKTHGHAVAAKSPEFLLEAVIQFALPFAPEKFDDLRAAVDEFGAVAPFGILGVGEGDPLGVARIPGVFGGLNFLQGRFLGEGGQGRARVHIYYSFTGFLG